MIFYVLIVLLVLCLYQDVRSRSIHWVLFPLLLSASILLNFEQLSPLIIGMNLIFLVTLMLGLTLYISLKNRQWTNITAGYFSWGDILFLVAVLPLFDFPSFILFFTVGTMITLVIHLIVLLFRKQNGVPYAGYMAFLGIVYLVFQDQLYQFTRIL